jgi:hypothetical protein
MPALRKQVRRLWQVDIDELLPCGLIGMTRDREHTVGPTCSINDIRGEKPKAPRSACRTKTGLETAGRAGFRSLAMKNVEGGEEASHGRAGRDSSGLDSPALRPAQDNSCRNASDVISGESHVFPCHNGQMTRVRSFRIELD